MTKLQPLRPSLTFDWRNMPCTIYCHTSPNGKRYVGCTSTSLNKRFQKGNGYKNNPRFWHDICEFGWDAFQHEILYTNLNSEIALELERKLINEWNLLDPDYGYNLWDGKGGRAPDSAERVSRSRRGRKMPKGRVLSDETKAKISNSLKAYYATHDNPFKNRHHTDEVIERLRHKTISEETRERMRKNHANVSGSNNPSARAVVQYAKNGEFIAFYDYAKKASDSLSIDLSAIIKCCRGKIKSAGGFVWKYASDKAI